MSVIGSVVSIVAVLDEGWQTGTTIAEQRIRRSEQIVRIPENKHIIVQQSCFQDL